MQNVKYEYGFAWMSLHFACEEHTSFHSTFTSISFFFFCFSHTFRFTFVWSTCASIPESLAFPYSGYASLDEITLQYWKHIFASFFSILSRMYDVRRKTEATKNSWTKCLAHWLTITHMQWKWESPGVKIQKKKKFFFTKTQTHSYNTVCMRIICKLTKAKHS